MTNVEINKKVLNKEKNYKLKRVATRGLVAIGVLTLSLIAYENIRIDKGFEYEQDEVTSLSTQYEEYSNKELPPEIKEALNELSSYEESFDNYEQISSVKGIDQDYLISARKDLISNVPLLIDVSNEVIRKKVISSLELSNNANIVVDREYNSVDGPEYSLNIIDVEKSLTVNNLPRSIAKILNLQDQILSYKGDGSNKAWNKAMKEYMSAIDNLYYLTIDLSGKNVKLIAKEYKPKAR